MSIRSVQGLGKDLVKAIGEKMAGTEKTLEGLGGNHHVRTMNDVQRRQMDAPPLLFSGLVVTTLQDCILHIIKERS